MALNIKSKVSDDIRAEAVKFKDKAEKIVARIAAERDKLRKLIYDYGSILESIDEAEDEWECVVDKLSELL